MPHLFEKHIAILELAAAGKLPVKFGIDEGHDRVTLGELVEAGCMTVSNYEQAKSSGFGLSANPKITIKGRECLHRWKGERFEQSLAGRAWQAFYRIRTLVLLALGWLIGKLAEAAFVAYIAPHILGVPLK